MRALFRGAKSPSSWQRLSRHLYLARVPILPSAITLFIRLIFGCFISHKTQVGEGLILGYGGLAIVIHQDATIGDHCHIDQCVTIGGAHSRPGVPKIGDRVYIGAGAKIIGEINVGDDAVIGANAVVLSDVPSGSVAVGVPARMIK